MMAGIAHRQERNDGTHSWDGAVRGGFSDAVAVAGNGGADGAVFAAQRGDAWARGGERGAGGSGQPYLCAGVRVCRCCGEDASGAVASVVESAGLCDGAVDWGSLGGERGGGCGAGFVWVGGGDLGGVRRAGWVEAGGGVGGAAV